MLTNYFYIKKFSCILYSIRLCTLFIIYLHKYAYIYSWVLYYSSVFNHIINSIFLFTSMNSFKRSFNCHNPAQCKKVGFCFSKSDLYICTPSHAQDKFMPGNEPLLSFENFSFSNDSLFNKINLSIECKKRKSLTANS